MPTKIAASILNADWAHLGDAAAQAEAAGADYLHLDVMDGHFVPNITVGPAVVAAMKQATRLPLDVHLMIEKPERYIADFARAGAAILTVHVEACTHLHRVLQQIRDLGVKPGVALNPATPLTHIEEVLEDLDLILVLTVNPGFGGQTLIPSTLRKLERLRRMVDAAGWKGELEVDGGINGSTTAAAVRAGADVLVVGSGLYQAGIPLAQAMMHLRREIARA